MEFMTAGLEIPPKKKSDDVMFDISLHGNPFNLVPATLGRLKKKILGRLVCNTRRLIIYPM